MRSAPVIRLAIFMLGAVVGGLGTAALSSPPAIRPSPSLVENPLPGVQAAAEERVRATRGGGETRFRGVQIYRQALPGVVAVCGQTNLGDGPNFAPFVAVVTGAAEGRPEVELFLARTGAEAGRAYAEGVARCFEGGGPVPRPGGGVLIPPSVPPLPDGLGALVTARSQAPPAASPPPATSPRQEPPAAAQPQPAPPQVAVREARPGVSLIIQANANLRTEPAGGSPVLRVARPGTKFSIFGEAPGGWYQVGTTAPEGWIHRSLATIQ